MVQEISSIDITKRQTWFALKVRSYCEWKVADYLNRLYIGEEKVVEESFIPIQKAYKNPTTGKTEHNTLAITNVVFIRILPKRHIIDAIRHSTNINDFYNIPGTNNPASIPDIQMERLQDLLRESPNRVTFINNPKKGDYVEVVNGSLKGLVGVLKHDSNGKDKLLVEIKIFGFACVEINKADTIPCDIQDKASESAIKRRLKDGNVQKHLQTFLKLYEHLSNLHLRHLSDAELCDLVYLYTQLLRSKNTLPVLRQHIWKENRYCYQDFYANVYIELANRVKENRNKLYRAPLLYALHCLCDQVSERAYTIKTNTRWVNTCIESINNWYLKYGAKGNGYEFVRLILGTLTRTVLKKAEIPSALLPIIKKWSESLSTDHHKTEGQAQTTEEQIVCRQTTAVDLANQLQLLMMYYEHTNDKAVIGVVKSWLPSAVQTISTSGSPSELIILCMTLNMVYRHKLTTSKEFQSLEKLLTDNPNTISMLCLRSICELYFIETSLRIDNKNKTIL